MSALQTKSYTSSSHWRVNDSAFLALATATAMGSILFVLAAIAGMRPAYNVGDYVLGEDFVNTWMSGRAALSGNPTPWLDVHSYNIFVHRFFGADFPKQDWSYPPHIMLVTWMFGLLPYIPAFILWNAIGLALYFATIMRGERRFDRLLFLAFAPAVISNLVVGQNGFVTAALMIGALGNLKRRPTISGLLFGLLTFKPQLGFLVPVMLAVTRQWRCIAAASITTMFLLVATSAIFGSGVWIEYFRVALPAQSHLMQEGHGHFFAYMPTAFMNMRLSGMPISFAWIVQALVSAFALAAALWTFWKIRDPVLSSSSFMTSSLLATPYLFPYDTVMLVWVIAKLRTRSRANLWDDAIALAVWSLPAMCFVLGLAAVPVTAFIPLILLVRILYLLRRQEYSGPPSENLVSADEPRRIFSTDCRSQSED